MTIQTDVWAGDLHQERVAGHEMDNWEDVKNLIREQVEGGMLCNVFHKDFATPEDRVEEANMKTLPILVSSLTQ